MKQAAPKEALIIIDMLNDFCLEGTSLEVPSSRQVIPNIAREIKRAREEGAPVIYVCDAHAKDDIEFANWPPHAVNGSEGAEVVEELKPLPGDHIVKKTTLLGFYKTELESVLKKTGATLLTITGCVTNICVMLIATEAVVRGYKVRVPADCCAWLNREMHEFALQQMAEVIKAEIV